MLKMRLSLVKVLLLTCFILLMCYTPIHSLKHRLKARQNSICANHATGDFVKNPDDCKLFYLCHENGEAVLASCPPNMLFNPATNICDTPANVNCEVTTTSPPTPPPPAVTTPPISTSMPGSSLNADQYCYNIHLQEPSSNALVFLAHPHNCQQYYMCYHGQALLQECSFNLHWNTKIGKCDVPSSANCVTQDVVVTSLPAPVPTDKPSFDGSGIICPSYGQHIFPHMERCDFFIYCVKGIAVLQKCPFYHHFDIESSRCKWRNVALCVKDLNLEFRKNKN